MRILDWGLTFWHCFVEAWIEEGDYSDVKFVRPQRTLLANLLKQALDPVTRERDLQSAEIDKLLCKVRLICTYKRRTTE